MKFMITALTAMFCCSMAFAQSDIDKMQQQAHDEGAKMEAAGKQASDKTKMEADKAATSAKKTTKKAKKKVHETSKATEDKMDEMTK